MFYNYEGEQHELPFPIQRNSKLRNQEIARLILHKYPGATVYSIIDRSTLHPFEGKYKNVLRIEYMDYTDQDIGGPPMLDAIVVDVYDSDRNRIDVFTIHDNTIPAPTLKPVSESVKMARYVANIDPMPDWPRITTHFFKLTEK
jgi:hypothetical protein